MPRSLDQNRPGCVCGGTLRFAATFFLGHGPLGFFEIELGSEDLLVEFELTRLVLRDTEKSQLVYLSEKGGSRAFPIRIGENEAAEIGRKVRSEPSVRPLTHDLIRNILDALDTELERVVVTDIKDDVFYARLHLRQESSPETIYTVDCRPSDAIALSVALKVPIFVDDGVLDTLPPGE